MLNAAAHVIRSETLELTVRWRDIAGALLEDARQVLTSDALPAIEDALTLAADPAEIVVLERVEVDLGTLSRESFARELLERLRSGLGETVSAAVRQLRARDERTPGAIVAAVMLPIEALRRFLLAGRMPWWVAGGSRVQPRQLLFDALETEPRTLAAMLRSLPATNTSHRLVRQFDAAAVERAIALLADTHGDVVARLTGDWLQLFTVSPALPIAPAALSSSLRQHLIELLIASTAAPRAEVLCHELTCRVSRDSGVDAGTLFATIAAEAERVLSHHAPLRRWLASKSAAVEKSHRGARPTILRGALGLPGAQQRSGGHRAEARADGQPEARPARRRAPQQRTKRAENSAGRSRRAPTPQPVMPEVTSSARPDGESSMAHIGRERAPANPTVAYTLPLEAADDEAIYVDNAGLVLLWPFLPRFFAAVGVVRDKGFVSPAAQERAVLVLHYLATGAGDSPEHQLVLPKLLAGWPEIDPVAGAIEPTDGERRESADLLASVLENWSALKGTSAEGLRTAFLLREGRLARGGNGWELTVARAGYDVLLERMPWALRMVVLPWMPQPLFVEW